jgi:hypothetical protein
VLTRQGNSIPKFPNVERWFTPEALLGVSIAVEFGLSLESFSRDAMLLALSSKMRSIGNVDVDVVRAEYSKKPRANVDVGRMVVHQLRRMADDVALSVRSHRDLIGPSSNVLLHEASVLDVELGPESIDFVITSPPYGIEAISYLRTHLLSYRSLVAHLHHDPYQTRDKTIGSEYINEKRPSVGQDVGEISSTYKTFFAQDAERPDSRQLARHAAMRQFFVDIHAVASRLSMWLKDGGQIAFVIGNKRLGERVIPTDVIVKELFASCDLEFLDVISHKLKTNNSNSQVPWQERIIQEESIMLFRRQLRSR